AGSSTAQPDPRITLWEAHGRWTPGKLDLSALYARGSISDLAAANAAHPGAANPVPSSFYGYFLQCAYELFEQGGYRAAAFARFERYNLGASYSGTGGPVVPTGLVPLSGSPGDLGYWPASHDRVWTAGANLYLGTQVPSIFTKSSGTASSSPELARPEPKPSSAKRKLRWRSAAPSALTCGRWLVALSSVTWKHNRCGSARLARR